MSNETALTLPGVDNFVCVTIEKIENVLEKSNLQNLAKMSPLQRLAVTSAAMIELKSVVSDKFVQQVFLPLMGSKLGFRTDRDREEQPYSIAVVREVGLEALIRGFYPWGNEFNIIAEGFYATKEGLDRKVKEWPGISNLNIRPMNPEMDNGNALVPCIASWTLNGTLDHIKCLKVKDKEGNDVDLRIPVRVNKGMIIDGILGKATRKMLAMIYEKLSGFTVPDGDTIEAEGVDVTTGNSKPPSANGGAKSAADDIAARHGKKSEPMREPGED